MAGPPLGDNEALQVAETHVAEQARRAVLLFELARQGLVPLAKVKMLVDARVVTEMGPLTPPTPGAPLGPARVGGVRVQMTGDRHAHVAAVAHSPAQAAGYVLEMRRDGAARPWVVTELSRVDERHLVGGQAQETIEDVIDRRTSRLPANLSGLIRATEHARVQAAEQLRRVETRHAEIGAQPRNTRRQRDAVARQAVDVRRQVTQWRSRLDDIDAELEELGDAAALRRMRAGVLAGDPVMSPRLSQLEIMLGPLPHDQAGRAGWRQTARQLLDYAAVWQVDSVLQDVAGAGFTDRDPGHADDRQVMRELVDDYRRGRGWAPLERVSVDQLQPGDRVLMHNGPRGVLTYRGAEHDGGRQLLQTDDGRVHHYSETSSRRTLWRAEDLGREHGMQHARGDSLALDGQPQLAVHEHEPELELDL